MDDYFKHPYGEMEWLWVIEGVSSSSGRVEFYLGKDPSGKVIVESLLTKAVRYPDKSSALTAMRHIFENVKINFEGEWQVKQYGFFKDYRRLE